MNREHIKQRLRESKLFFLVALLSLGAGILIGSTFLKEVVVVREGTADTPAAMSSVNIMIDYGNGKIKTWNTVSWHESMSIMNLLETLASANGIILLTKESGKGLVVESIDGIRNDSKTGTRWQYWINNIREPRVPGKYYLKPGDLVVWKYVKEQFE